MSKELRWDKCAKCNDEIGWPADGSIPICYDCLAARVRELEAMYESSHASRMHAESVVQRLEAESEALKAAVRWKIGKPLHPNMSGDEKWDMAIKSWIVAHPIVREVIEKGGE